MHMNPFRRRKEGPVGEPQVVIVREGGANLRSSSVVVRVTLNPDGSVANRERVPNSEAQAWLDLGHAVEVDEGTLSKITAGELPVTSLLTQEDGDPEEESGGIVARMRRESAIGGERRARKIDEAIELATGNKNN